MKKTFLFLAITFSSLLLNAQTEKGDQLIGGIGMLRVNQSGRNWYSHGTTDLIYQYFLFNNFSVGAGMEYQFSHAGNLEFSNRYRSIYVLPETRYYFLKESVRPYVYLNGGTGYFDNHSNLHYYKKSGMGPWKTEAGVGLSWFVAPHLSLEARVGFTTSWRTSYETTHSALNAKIGVQFSIPHHEKKTDPGKLQ